MDIGIDQGSVALCMETSGLESRFQQKSENWHVCEENAHKMHLGIQHLEDHQVNPAKGPLGDGDLNRQLDQDACFVILLHPSS